MAGRTRSPGRGRGGHGSATEQEFAVIDLGSFGASLARRLLVDHTKVIQCNNIENSVSSMISPSFTIPDIFIINSRWRWIGQNAMDSL